jgi:hypothetical protein
VETTSVARSVEGLALYEDGGQEGPLPLEALAPALPPLSATLLAYWADLRHGQPIPPRAGVDPIALAKILPNLFMVRFEGPPRVETLRFSVHGTEVARIVGGDLTGKVLADVLEPAAAARVGRAILACAQGGLPVRERLWSAFPGRDHVRVDRLVLPLLDEVGDVGYACGSLVRLAPDDLAPLAAAA